MGEFNFGCAITNVAISEGEKVLQVVVKKPRLAELYELRQTLIMLRNSRKPSNDGSEYDDFIKFLQETREREFTEDITVRYGIYNGYGWLNNVKDENEELPQFMIKQNVVIELAKFLNFDSKDLVTTLYFITNYMHVCRINPFHTLGGLQYFDEMEEKYQTFRLYLTRNELEKKSDELFEEDRL